MCCLQASAIALPLLLSPSQQPPLPPKPDLDLGTGKKEKGDMEVLAATIPVAVKLPVSHLGGGVGEERGNTRIT